MLVASYEYDAFGSCTLTTHVSGETIGELNPIRYRGYYYDSETGLYYLQSRYYNANVGRFLNADGYVSTGQGVLGHNMFAYCGNNPVRSCDPCGTCLHQWRFWNDCEKCGGRTLLQKTADYIDRINAINQQTAQLETQIIIQQNKAIQKTSKSLWDAYVLSNVLQSEAKQEQMMGVNRTVEYMTSNPLVAIDAITGTVGLGTTYIGVLGTIGVFTITPVGQITLGVIGGACSVWGVYRVYTVIWDDLYSGDD